ncbi:STAS domain-containing protein [Lentzea tibetensis]|nr:STAS domain-containing protein [Lentzea tibetensis]
MSEHVPDVPDSVTATEVDGVPVVRVTGEVDEHTVEPIRSALTAQFDRHSPAIVLDLCATTFFGSTGLSVLVESQQRAENQDVVFAVVAPQRAVLRPMAVTGVDRVVHVHQTLPDALAAVRIQLVS